MQHIGVSIERLLAQNHSPSCIEALNTIGRFFTQAMCPSTRAAPRVRAGKTTSVEISGSPPETSFVSLRTACSLSPATFSNAPSGVWLCPLCHLPSPQPPSAATSALPILFPIAFCGTWYMSGCPDAGRDRQEYKKLAEILSRGPPGSTIQSLSLWPMMHKGALVSPSREAIDRTCQDERPPQNPQ